MDDKIINLDEYKDAISIKKELDNKTMDVSDLSIDEIDSVTDLYVKEIKNLRESIERRKANIERLDKENEELRKLIRERGIE